MGVRTLREVNNKLEYDAIKNDYELRARIVRSVSKRISEDFFELFRRIIESRRGMLYEQ